MSDAYRTSDIKPDAPVEPVPPKPPSRLERFKSLDMIGWCCENPGLVLTSVAAVLLIWGFVYTMMNASRWDEEARAEAIAKPIRERVCGEQGPKNARAWAAFMRLKDPAVLCIWDARYTQGCGGVVTCSIGAESAVYGILCKVGDGAEDEGKADRCWLTSGGGR